MSADELIAAKKGFVKGLDADLAEPVWQTFPVVGAILGPMRTNSLSDVVNGLVNENDTIADMEIFFTPPVAGASDAGLYMSDLRYVKVSLDGVLKFNEDMSRISKEGKSIVINVPVSSGVRIEFYSDVVRSRASSSCGEENWLLPRLIQKDQAQRMPNRDSQWKLSLPVMVNGNARTLGAFEIRLKTPLPKKESWPK